jgi:hypothetical protein
LELVDADISRQDMRFGKLINSIEEGLRENFHYYCRQLGQLDYPKVFLINGSSGQSGLETYFKRCQSLGQRAGNIKPAVLHNKIGWSEEFSGRFI